MSAGIVRFLANPQAGVLLELGNEGASASLAAAFHREFGCDPDYEKVAVAGMHFDLGNGERGLCISRTPSAEAANDAIKLVAVKWGFDSVRRLARPPYGTASSKQGTASGLDWVFDMERHRYDSSAVTVWPVESSRPVRDRIVIEHADQQVFVHRARRSRVEWCPPAATLDEALTFASVESAQAWVERHGATERQPLVLRYRSVAAALLDQAEAQVTEETCG